jgi:hypothetical protein
MYKISFFYADWKSKLATISRFMGDPVGNQSLEGPFRSHHLGFHIRTKNLNFVEDYPVNIPV